MKKRTTYRIQNKIQKITLVLIISAFLCSSLSGGTAHAEAPAEIIPSTVSRISQIAETGKEPTSTIELGADKNSIVITPVTMKYAGVLQLTVQADATTSNIVLEVFSNEPCTESLGNSIHLSASMPKDTAIYAIKTSGTYYIKASYTSYDDVTKQPVSLKIFAGSYFGEGEELEKGSASLIYTALQDVTLYHQIKVKKAGMITLKGRSFYLTTQEVLGLTVTLYDKDKNPISEECTLSSGNKYKNYYAVDKGTYYVGVEEFNPYTLSYTFKATNQADYGDSQEEAPALANVQKKPLTFSGILANGASPEDSKWYRFSLNQKTKKTIFLTGTGNVKSYYVAHLYIEKNGKLHKVAERTVNNNGKGVSLCKRKLAPGTYYLTVDKKAQTSGTSFTISIK